jgi:ABC-type antimicrobial peptide transport system permease subunit
VCVSKHSVYIHDSVKNIELKLEDTILTAYKGLKEQKFRLALNVLGILIGCAAVTGLVSITQGLSVEVSGQLEMFGPNNIMVIPFEIRQGRGLVGEGFNWRDIAVMEKIPNVKYMAPIIANKFGTYTIRGDTYRGSVFGVTPLYFEVYSSFEIADGRALIQADTGSCVIGHLISQPMGEEEPLITVGDRITLSFYVGSETKDATFRVVGVLEEVGGTFGSEDDSSILLPFREAQTIFETGSTVDFVALQVDQTENVDLVVDEINNKFEDRVMVMSFELIQEQVGQVLGTIEAVLGGIAAISLLVAGVSIINTMTISVMERTREIGILKAIGSKSTEILLLFISEATITGILGGVLGSALGFALGVIVGDWIGLPVSVTYELGGAVIMFAVFTSVIAGLYPSWQASRLHPVEALRYE